MVESGRLIVAAAIAAGIGTALLFSELRWFRRVSLTERLSPFTGAGSRRGSTSALVTFRTTLGPLTTSVGEQIAKLFGARDDISIRLQRAGMDVDVTTFRLRQFAWAGGALLVALLATAAIRPVLPLIALMLLGAPLLAFLILEQDVMGKAQKNQKQLFAELPVLSEQLAMLLSAGFSLTAALNHIADRNHGIGGRGLKTVSKRIRHGLTPTAALREWAALEDVAELHRLVSILSLANETTELGRLVSDEAKNVRRESQRRLAETIEKRSQQVWIPVTVATLVPGVIFLIIPFLQALRLFAGN